MKTDVRVFCHHCHSEIKDNNIFYSEYTFCCHGCVQVYQLLSDNNLCQYYDIDQNAGIKINEWGRSSKYDFLELAEHRDKIVKYSNGVLTHILVSIPQINCASCLWLLERLYKLNEHIHSTQVFFEKKEVYIVFDESKLPVKQLIQILASIGYEPNLNFEVENETEITSKRTEILKIGLAGFCFANIMMLCLPEYFASGIVHATLFRQAIPYILIGLSLPVLFYAATDFFVSAFKGLKKGIINIDLPVALAIVITFGRSLFEISQGISNGYLDSMSGIVFFMLIGRWLQNRTHNYLQFNRNHLSYFPIAVERMREGKSQIIPIHEIQVRDAIKIYSNEIIPVDSILSKGQAVIDYSFVNGESKPIAINIGEHIYAGGRQMDGAIELIVMKEHSQSQLTTLWNRSAFSKSKDTENGKWTDCVGLYFTILVLLLAGIAGGYWYVQGEFNKMWNAISTVLIVACPCALLLASSFTYGQILRVLGEYKCYLRNSSIIDKLYQIRHIVFDKTGTLTHSNAQQVSYSGTILDAEQKSWISSILFHSNHPLSRSVYDFLAVDTVVDSVNFKETMGAGIEGWIQDHYIKIGSDEFCQIEKKTKNTHFNVLIDNVLVGEFQFSNVYRLGISKLLQKIQETYRVTILSGDSDNEYKTLRKIIYPDNNILFNQSPIQKLEYVEKESSRGECILMIGDGLNDAGAFQASTVAIALTEKNNFFNPASDIILDADMLPRLNQILDFIFKTKKIVKISFVYSVIYNVIGLYFALQGILSPVIAAILMPISSISIILFIHFMTEFYHSKYLKNNP